MIVTAGALNPVSATTSAIVSSVPEIVCCRPVVPQRTIATGVSPARPFSLSAAVILPIRSTPINTTFVPGSRAMRSQSMAVSALSGSS